MVDVVDKETRSRMMAGIHGRNTKPELLVRSGLHRLGLRFRLHGKLPGKPDIVLRKHQTAVFVHGCFWHRHPGCRFCTTPSTNVLTWRRKFRQNVERDARKAAELRDAGWHVLTIWACEISPASIQRLATRIRRNSPRQPRPRRRA